jgi:hypothetical protein
MGGFDKTTKAVAMVVVLGNGIKIGPVKVITDFIFP